MKLITLVLLTAFTFSCAVEQDNQTKSVSNVEENTEAENTADMSGERSKEVEQNMTDFFFVEDIKILEEILGKVLSEEEAAKIKEKIMTADPASKIAFFKLFKEDLSACLGIYESFKDKEADLKAILADTGVSEIKLDELSSVDLNSIRDKILIKSAAFLPMILAKKESFASCAASVSGIYKDAAFIELKEKYFPEGKVKAIEPYTEMKSISCEEESDELSITCVTYKDLACDVKKLIEDRKYFEAKDLLFKVDFTKITSCVEGELSKIHSEL